MRIRGLGVIDDAVLELAPGLTVVTGETGAGKTMVVTGLGPAVRRPGRPRRRPRRRRARPSSRAGCASTRRARSPSGPREAGGRARRRRARRSPAPSRPRAAPAPTSAAAACPAACSPSWPSPAWPCTASPTSRGCCSRPASATALDRYAGAAVARAAGARTARRSTSCARSAPSSPSSPRAARERAQEADLLRFGLDEIEAVDPQPGEDAGLRGRGGAARPRRRAARPRPHGRTAALLGDRRRRRTAPDATAPGRRPPAQRWSRPASTTPRWPSSAAGCARSATCWPTSAPTLASYAAGGRDRPGPAGGGAGAAGRADPADPQVRRRRPTAADRRRRACSPGRSGRGPADRARRRRRPDRRAAARARRAASPSWPSWPAELSAARHGSGRSGSRPRSTAELAALAMPHAARRGRRDADASGDRRTGLPVGGPAARLRPARRRRRRDAAAPAPRGARRGRCRRAPPAASCRG